MNTKLIFPVLCAMVLFVACRKEEVPEPDLGYGYFPTKLGTWVEYQVDSTWRDDRANVRDSVSYRLRERIVEHYTDLEGRPCQKIHRFVLDDAGEWVVRDVWTATANTYAAEKTEENERRLKLSFPVRNARRWDINVYNTEKELEVAYREKGNAWAAGGLSFANTVLVKNTVPANNVDRRDFEERYAEGVGMVEKRQWELKTQPVYDPNNANIIIGFNTSGFSLRMVAVAYGAE
ncbi:MAG: hypothetical protein KF797_08625 [Flavobacteriales bacterium]|nr:hypothetical protein [Flavobacteriales bacterium]